MHENMLSQQFLALLKHLKGTFLSQAYSPLKVMHYSSSSADIKDKTLFSKKGERN